MNFKLLIKLNEKKRIGKVVYVIGVIYNYVIVVLEISKVNFLENVVNVVGMYFIKIYVLCKEKFVKFVGKLVILFMFVV